MTSAAANQATADFRNQRLLGLVDQFAQARVGVIGDLLCDVYISGLTERVSREAPVLIVKQETEWVMPGGAANTAVNASRLGAATNLVGILGQDQPGRCLEKKIVEGGVDIQGIVRSPDRRTISKTRFLAGATHTSRQQVLRLDRHPDQRPGEKLLAALRRELIERSDRVDAWIVNDYGYDSFDLALRSALAEVSRTTPVIVDSRFDLLEFRGVTLAKPNEEEARAATRVSDPRKAARKLRDLLDLDSVLVTLGNQGMYLQQGETGQWIPAAGTDEIVDLTGAGDTVAAVLGCALARGADLADAAHLANLAGGLVVMKEGAASLTAEELKNAINTRG